MSDTEYSKTLSEMLQEKKKKWCKGYHALSKQSHLNLSVA